MRFGTIPVRDLPARLATGGYILHSGVEKWSGDDAHAERLHAFASGAFPFLRAMAPRTFLKLLSVGEIGLGVALVAPVVPNALAGAGLSAFAGGLVGMYLRTPAMHRPNSIWPTPAGIGVSKDVWMLGIGLGLLADGVAGDRDS